MNKDDIKSFVVGNLGCSCPVEVFNIINWQKHVQINSNIIVNYKINIGNRLLIYIIDIDDVIFLNQNLVKVIRIGIGERDNNKFNRLKIVIISNNIAKIGSVAQKIFNNLNIDDQKVHLHVMRKTDIVL